MNLDHLTRQALSRLLEMTGHDRRVARREGLDYFKDHIMDPAFDYKHYLHTPHPYFRQVEGVNISSVESEYYSQASGIRSDLYVPTALFYNLFVPYLGKKSDRVAYQDKNSIHRYLDVRRDAAEAAESTPRFGMARIVASNMNGFYYDSDDEPCTEDEAVRRVVDYPDDLIIKPTVDTTWGHGVALVPAQGKTEASIRQLMHERKKNYNFQEVVHQHHLLATFNASSLNTLRVWSYRRPDGSIRVMPAVLRFGGKGSVVDNASAGGGSASVGPDGTLRDRKVRQYRKLDTGRYLDDSVTNEIPYYDRIREVVATLHRRLPYFDIIGWDMTVTEEGTPYVIEYNFSPGIEHFQISNGPAFTREELDELMPRLLNHRVTHPVGTSVFFADRYGFENNEPLLD